MEASQPPRSGRDLLDAVLFEEVTGCKLGCPFVLDLLVGTGVCAEGRENNIAGKDAVDGGVAAGDGFAGLKGGHGRVPVPLSQAKSVPGHEWPV